MANSQNNPHPTISGIRQSPSTKKRLIDGAVTVLDIAKESSDAFPPLKSCLGAIDAFRKHYEQMKDVEEKLGDLIPWLKKLENTVVTPTTDINPEEAERRKQLTRIWKRAQGLSGKGRLAQFLDKRRDSGAIARLTEELRQAILLYQLSQQGSIDNQVSQLASSLNAFLKLHEKALGIKGKIQSTLARLDRLKVEGSTVKDEGEAKRRKVLFGTLEGIKYQLETMSERSNEAEYHENDGDMHAVCELAEDIRNAVVEYQLCQQKALYEQNCKLIDKADSQVLNSCRRAHEAGFQHGDRTCCLKGTRESVLDKIEQWAGDSEQPPIFWLNGLAGTGKSTIAQTVAKRLFADDRLGASFFCSRGSVDLSNPQLILPTLAFQLAQKYQEFRSPLLSLLESNPDIAYQPLQDQMEQFLIEPFRATDISTVIIIDALDECKDEGPEPAILSVLGKSVEDIPGVKFFITSRPEDHIASGFDGPLLGLTDVFILHRVDPSTINNDIRRFLEYELSKLARRSGGKKDWPTNGQLDWLCQRSSGFFIYAVATVNFLDHHLEDPWDQLDTIMRTPESTAYEGETRLKTYKSLDTLYVSILLMAFRDNKAKDDDIVRSVLGCVVLATDPLPPSTIATLMDLGLQKVRRTLNLIQSLLVLSSDPNEPVRLFHKSFSDFITDVARCVDTRFHISLDHCHSQLFMRCLELIRESREKMPPLPNCDSLSEGGDLPMVAKNDTSDAVRYACISWHVHLAAVEYRNPDVGSTLLNFLEENFVTWLAVLRTFGVLSSGRRAMEEALVWVRMSAKDEPSTQLRHLLNIAISRKDLVAKLTPNLRIYQGKRPVVSRAFRH